MVLIKMDVLVECIAEAMDEADGAKTGVPGRIGAALEQFLPDHPQQDMQNRTGKAVGEDTALQIAPEVALDIAWYRRPVPIAFPSQHQVGFQVLLGDAVEEGLLRMTTRVYSRSTSP